MSLIYKNVHKLVFITCLYILQGIPQGFSKLMVLALISAKSNYRDIAIFTTAYYPYSLKILWSPLVDAIYSPKIGRRKSWIIPTQMLMGFLFLLLGTPARIFSSSVPSHIHLIDFLVAENRIWPLTCIFVFLFLSTSTQDIALDAWALQLLPSQIKPLASTCQTAGLNIGNALGYNAIILATTSGSASLGYFCLLFGFAALFLNFGVFFFAFENPESFRKDGYKVSSAYSSIWSMCCLPNVRALMMVALTSVVPFAVNLFLLDSHAVASGLIEKNMLAMMDFVSVPVSLVVSGLISKYLCGSYLRHWLRFFSTRLVVSGLLSLFVFISTNFLVTNHPPQSAQLLGAGLYISFSALDKSMFILYFAFCAKICDETFGGTYLTLLAVVYNLGHVWIKNLVYLIFDELTRVMPIKAADPYFLLSVVCFCYGAVWKVSMEGVVHRLDGSSPDEWKLSHKLS